MLARSMFLYFYFFHSQFILMRARSMFLFVILLFVIYTHVGPEYVSFFYEYFRLVFGILKQLSLREVVLQELVICWTVLEVSYIF